MYFMYFTLLLRSEILLVVSVFNVINDVMFNENESVFWLLHREMSHQPHKASPNVDNTVDFKKSLKDWQMHFFNLPILDLTYASLGCQTYLFPGDKEIEESCFVLDLQRKRFKNYNVKSAVVCALKMSYKWNKSAL